MYKLRENLTDKWIIKNVNVRAGEAITFTPIKPIELATLENQSVASFESLYPLELQESQLRNFTQIKESSTSRQS